MSGWVFWPGFSWRILAHKRNGVGKTRRESYPGWWLCGYCGWRDIDYKTHPKKCPGSIGAFDFERFRPDPTRRIVHSSTVELDDETFPEPVEFDELVIDHWFHLEQMDDRDWWIGLGSHAEGSDFWHINIHIDGKKRVTISMEQENQAEEAGIK